MPSGRPYKPLAKSSAIAYSKEKRRFRHVTISVPPYYQHVPYEHLRRLEVLFSEVR
ncbi:hypothetical protein GCM10009332_14840 [Shewanella gelidii]|uniref:Uncharacterized protein n=1 Tax=Shewanella gelidii TaxID=1642821 RepID=A0A917JPJ5_9GAMM|nr:hypothetical protein GCM10009332_14840 [Shewanella gelidii]